MQHKNVIYIILRKSILFVKLSIFMKTGQKTKIYAMFVSGELKIKQNKFCCFLKKLKISQQITQPLTTTIFALCA